MKKSKSTSEWDNLKNIPTLSKKPGVGVREYPSKMKAATGHELHVSPASEKQNPNNRFGRGKSRKQKAAKIIAKARKGY